MRLRSSCADFSNLLLPFGGHTTPTPSTHHDTIVIGGGFYGCNLALHAATQLGHRTRLVEMAPRLMSRASYNNQARVHNGYHYPRSYLTGLRSRLNAPRFLDDYRDCVDDSFEKYYAIARRFSHVTAAQFANFCRHIGARIEPAPKSVRSLFDSRLIEDVFRVQETAFDADKLRSALETKLHAAGVDISLETEVVAVARSDDGVKVTIRSHGETSVVRAHRVLNCTYSRLNKVLTASKLSPVPLKHEVTEIALVSVPPPFEHLGITVMCGPFFSVMPFPPKGLHSFSHVRYTPHGSWTEDEKGSGSYRDPYEVLAAAPKQSRFLEMVKDAQRYIPLLADCTYRESLWEIKTVLPKNEVDDGRPILLKSDEELNEVSSVMGSKIDNVYDVLDFFPQPSL